jgi:hypothetical protein
MVRGLPLLPRIQPVCEPCLMGKQHRHNIPKTRTSSSSRPLELVHSDLCGPFPKPSMTGSRYMLTFIDDYSRHCWVFFLATKNETFASFKQFRKTVEKQIQKPVSCLRTDRRGKFLSTEFNNYCKLEGIRRQLTAAGTPQQNGIAERKNRHLCESMRTLLHDANLLPSLWEEAIRTANYIANRGPHKALHQLTPFQLFTGTKPNISHFRIFGSTAYIHIQKRNKLEPKSKALILVGYDEQTKAYRTLDYDRRKIIISRDVVFDETKLGLPNSQYTPSSDDDIFRTFVDQNSSSALPEHSSDLVSYSKPPSLLQSSLPMQTVQHPNTTPSQLEHLSPAPCQPLNFPSSPNISPSPIVYLPSLPFTLHNPITYPLRRSQRFRKQNVRLNNYILSITPQDFDLCIPEQPIEPLDDQLTLNDALQHPGWTTTMNDELHSIAKNQT